MNIRIDQLDFATPEYDEYLAFRYKYLREPINLEFEVDQVEKEYAYKHFAVYHSRDGIVACLMLVPSEEVAWQMKQVAVAEKYRGQGIGTFLVQEIEKYAKSLGVKKLFLHAREEAVPFYNKLNYTLVGKPFMEILLPHYYMEKFIID